MASRKDPYLVDPVFSVNEAFKTLPNDLFSVKPISFNDATSEWQKIANADNVNELNNQRIESGKVELARQKEDEDLADKVTQELQNKYGENTDTTDTDAKYKDMLSYAEQEYLSKGRIDKAISLRSARDKLDKQSQPILRSIGGNLMQIDPETGETNIIYEKPQAAPKPESDKRVRFETAIMPDGSTKVVDPYNRGEMEAITSAGGKFGSSANKPTDPIDALIAERLNKPTIAPPPSVTQPAPSPQAKNVDWSKIDPKYDSVTVGGVRYRRP